MTDSEPRKPTRRSPAIDALRGAAIVTMFAANLAAPCLLPPHPMWLRVYGSFAAPAFVLLAGMMTCISGRPPPLSKLLKRSLLLVALAALIDVLCWRIEPFVTFDVLYLLGLALPVAGLCARLPGNAHLGVAVAIIAVTPWLQRQLGYGPLLPDSLPSPAWRRAIVDGWFPIFPWLGVAVLGGWVGRLQPLSSRAGRWLFPGALVLGAAGMIAWWLRPPQVVTRAGYSELFYPPSPQYLATAVAAVLLLLWLLHHASGRFELKWLATFGRSSLLLYVVHVALIALVFDEWFQRRTLRGFLALYVGMALSLWLVAWAKQRYFGRVGTVSAAGLS